jgi:hypothetical protein
MKKEKEKEEKISKEEEINNKEDDNLDEKSDATEELKLEEKENDKKENKKKKKKKKIKKKEIEEETEEDKLIKETMGFNKFSSTKGKSHKDSDASAVFLGRKAKRIYQRFMNYKPFSKILKQAYMSLNQEF